MLDFSTRMAGAGMNLDKGTLVAELLVLFLVLPALFRLLPMRLSPLPALWAASLYCLFVLRHAPGFSAAWLWNARPMASSLGNVLTVFAVAAVVLTAAVWRLRPHLLFGFVRSSPLFWALVMVLYPVLSVYPQGIIYRAFFFERYRPLFPSATAMLVASAAAFGFSHIIFRNPWSVALTFLAGLLFAWRYHATDSLLVSSLEHALYGCFVFTVGLGGLFYHGAGRAALGR
jgi:membrane protease YdiL (CAAX protease family)